MFSTKEFQDWAKENVVRFAAVMTHIEGREDDDLLRTYGFRGFPSLALLDENGEALMKGIGRDVQSMSSAVTATRDHAELKAKIAAGEPVDPGRWLLARLGLNQLGLDEARAEFESLELEGEQRQAVIGHLVLLELQQLQGQLRQGQDKAEAAQQRVFEMYREGWKPPAGASQQVVYDMLLVAAAKDAEDKDAFAYAYQRVRDSMIAQQKNVEAMLERYKDNPQMLERVKPMVERMQQQLEELDATAEKFGVH